jgi:hypothetical protein
MVDSMCQSGPENLTLAFPNSPKSNCYINIARSPREDSDYFVPPGYFVLSAQKLLG